MSLFKNLQNRFRKVADEVAESVKDDEANATYAIEDAEKKIAEIKGKLAKVVSDRITSRKKVDSKQKEVEKWLSVAKSAKASGNIEDARQALEQKNKISRELQALEAGLLEIETGEKNMRDILNKYETKVARAKSNKTVLSARANTAKMRKELAASAAGIDGDSVLSALDELEDDVNEDEAMASAYEEMASTSNATENLADKYADSVVDSNIDDELEKL